MKKLIVFDFDGTLTRRDSMLVFVQYYHGAFRFWLGMIYLSPVLVLYKIGVIPNWKAKEILLGHFFGRTPFEKFQSACDRFASERLPGLIRDEALSTLEGFRSSGFPIVVVSASPENWLNAWGEAHNLTIIGTRLQVYNGHITGKIDGGNCYGPEKVNRLRQQFDLNDFSEIIVFGDSRGDKELFELATEYHYKPFRNGS